LLALCEYSRAASKTRLHNFSFLCLLSVCLFVCSFFLICLFICLFVCLFCLFVSFLRIFFIKCKTRIHAVEAASEIRQNIFTSFCFLVVAIEATPIKKHHVSNCHDNNIVLDCPPFAHHESGDAELIWQYGYNNNTANSWTTITKMDSKGMRMTTTNGSHLEGRLTIYRNGSIGISQLQQEDERMYRCEVLRKLSMSGISRTFHFVEIKLTCKGTSDLDSEKKCPSCWKFWPP